MTHIIDSDREAAEAIVAANIDKWGWRPLDEIEGLAEYNLAVDACAAGIAAMSAEIERLKLQLEGLLPTSNGNTDAAWDAGYAKGCDDTKRQAYNEALEKIDQLRRERAVLEEALEPSGSTKAAYMGEFSFTLARVDEFGDEYSEKVYVPWTTIKEIMAAIKDRATLSQQEQRT